MLNLEGAENTFKLKPCPFCGGQAEFQITSTGARYATNTLGFRIRCNQCTAHQPRNEGVVEIGISRDGQIEVKKDDRSRVVKMWNERADNERL